MIDLIEIQKLIYDRLSLLPYTVVNEFVQYSETTTPFIQVGSLHIADNNTKNTKSLEIEQYINVYSTYRGKKEILQISQDISEVMNETMKYTTNKIDANNNLQEVVYKIFIDEDTRTIMLDEDKNGNKFYHAVLIFNLHIN